jgi:hypothetical protein
MCLAAVRIPTLAAVMILLMLTIEQVVQSVAPGLRSGGAGQAINYAIGIMEILSLMYLWTRDPSILRGGVTGSLLATFGLLAWALISLAWSPGREDGLGIVAWGFPYLVTTVVIAPFLIVDIKALSNMMFWLVVVGTATTAAFLLSPEFRTKDGRLVMDLGAGAVSSALIVGELGGTLLISAALARGGGMGRGGLWLRGIAVASGIALAIMSGSRGQFFFALAVVVLFIPLAAPVRNIRAFAATAIGIAIVILIASFAMDTILGGFAAKRFSADEILYGSSSASGRWQNTLMLFNAWAREPIAIVIGLGYNAFSGLPQTNGEPYSHVLFADAIFELGLPGAGLLFLSLYLGIKDSISLFRTFRHVPAYRAACASLCAQIVYQILLVNKQGSLWGIPVLFFYTALASRLYARATQGFDENSPKELDERRDTLTYDQQPQG